MFKVSKVVLVDFVECESHSDEGLKPRNGNRRTMKRGHGRPEGTQGDSKGDNKRTAEANK